MLLRAGFTASFALGGLVSLGADPARLEGGVMAADLIVLGRLSAVERSAAEWTSSTGSAQRGERGTARLAIDEVLAGDAGAGEALSIAWTYLDHVDPLDGRNPHEEITPAVYFLSCSAEGRGAEGDCVVGEGTVWTEQLWAPIAELDAVRTALGRFPVRIQGETVHALGSSIPVRLELVNRGAQEVTFPGIRFEEGQLTLGPGVTLTVHRGSITGRQAPRRVSRLRQDPEAPPITIAPGARHTIDLDLAKPWGLVQPGTYVLSVTLDGYPPQPPFPFRIE